MLDLGGDPMKSFSVLPGLVLGSLLSFSAHAGPDLFSLISVPHDKTNSFFSLSDSNGKSMDGLNVQQEGPTNFIGAYHTNEGNDRFCVRLATTNDVRSGKWTYRTEVDCNYGSQPDIKRLPDGRYLLAYEKNNNKRPHIIVRSYSNVNDLLINKVEREFAPPYTDGARTDGTPSFRWIRYDGRLDTMTIELGYHFNRLPERRDVNAIGFLRGFKSWDYYVNDNLNNLVDRYAGWHIGDRSFLLYQGKPYTIIEGMTVKDDWQSWRLYLHDETANTLTPLNFRTPGRSPSMGNPSFSVIQVGNQRQLVGTNFIFGPAAEPGSHMYILNIDNTDAAVSYGFSPPYRKTWAAHEMQHQFGTRELDGWSAQRGQKGHMIYGPYERGLPHAPMQVNFTVQTDLSLPTSDVIAVVDVNDATADKIIATREIRRSDFRVPLVYQTIPLNFDWRGRVGHAVEFRVYTKGTSYIKVSNIAVSERF